MVRVIPKDLVLSSDITNNEAQEQCLEIGGDGLMTVATNDTLNYFLKGDYLEDIKMTPRFHVGIIKKDVSLLLLQPILLIIAGYLDLEASTAENRPKSDPLEFEHSQSS